MEKKLSLEIFEVTSGVCAESSCKPPDTDGDDCQPVNGWPCGPGV